MCPIEVWPQEVTDLLPRTNFPSAGSELACAVSGGADSLALMALGVAAGCVVTAVHVDHGLRPEGPDEARLVAGAAASVGARFESIRVAVDPGPNLEARARAARFTRLPPEVATGHTMDDQAETVLSNLLRGAGVDGLAGMRAGHRHPLLGIRRAEAAEACRALGLRWVEDPSNDDPRFLRNRIRHELLPLCCRIAQRDLVPVLARQACLLADEAEELDALASSALPDPSDAKGLAAAPVALARRAVRGWLRQARYRGASGDLVDRHPPTLAEVERVLGVARGLTVATQLEGALEVRRSRGRLYLDRT